MKRFFLPSLLGALLLTACNQGAAPSQPAATQPLSVTASFYPLAYLAEEIGGANISVTQVTPGGVEPHDYEPSPTELVAVHNAKVFLMNGAGVDGWGDKVIDELQQNGVVTVRMADSISVMGGFSEEGEEDPTHPSSADMNVQDPHIWLDPVLVKQEAALIRDAFITVDPAHADTYRANADQLLQQLSSLDSAYRSGLANCSQTFIVTSHNAFRYMAKEYGFQSLAIAGINAEEEPSSKRMAELADLSKAKGIKYIFFETLLSPKLAETVAQEIGAQSLVLNPIEGLTPEDEAKGADYFTIMQENLQNLRTAMECQ